MKKLMLMLMVVLLLMPAIASGAIQHTIVTALSYGARGPEFTNVVWGEAYLAVRMVDILPDGAMTLWCNAKYNRTFEYVEVGGPGAEAFIVMSTWHPNWFIYAGGGFLYGVAMQGDDELDLGVGATYEFGAAWDFSQHGYFIGGVEAIDRGDLNHVINIKFGVGIHNLFTHLLGGK